VALLGAVGLTLLLVRGSVFARVRRSAPALFACALCTGWWVGLAVELVRTARTPIEVFAWAGHTVLFAASTAVCAMTVDLVHAWLDAGLVK
jgi:hypothetical protein